VSEFAAKDSIDILEVEATAQLLRDIWQQLVLEEGLSLDLRDIANGLYLAVLHYIHLPQPVHVEWVASGCDDVAQAVLSVSMGESVRLRGLRSRYLLEAHLLGEHEHSI
jgi:hypothetical protein